MTEPLDPRSVVPTPEQLRGVAHPVRMRMLGLLRWDGPQTATSLAARLGLNTGATSYHLRQLAQHGFVVEAPALGSGRERWWRAAHRSTEVPDATVSGAGAFIQTAIVRQTHLLQESAEEFDELPDEWKQASSHSDWVIRLSAADARGLADHIAAYLSDRQAAPAPPADGTEQVLVQLHVFPRPGAVPHDTDGR